MIGLCVQISHVQPQENDLNFEMKIADIPQSVMDNVVIGLQGFLIPILGQSKIGEIPELIPVGSGTLVKVGRMHYVLTAAHVWHKAKRFERIHFVLASRAPSGFWIPRTHISAKQLWNGESSEWGPDLALLEIPHHYVGTIAAHKAFLNLLLQKATFKKYPPKTKKGFWAITGMVGESSIVQHHPEVKTVTANIICNAWLSTIQDTRDRQGFDYLHVSANLDLPGLPRSFGGTSGGGLWQIDLSKDTSGVISWDGKRHFRGVAFWETEPIGGRLAIRCHGPRSIFQKAWKEWGLPQEE